MIAQPQWSQRGAIAWIAHSNESKAWLAPETVISMLLSQSLPQTSQVANRLVSTRRRLPFDAALPVIEPAHPRPDGVVACGPGEDGWDRE